ncbi:hypothetical protein [Mesonia aestuariivivens]|uniref:Uncharacterized protein n=1 Tax=Mesonia aestuariivivens TaxID=2796128 RepID=A0ABS6W0X6_9FLAO|nr:hypothetical protein [Mesonia aestuariivivens]MBW2961506.1 hypothetical protein [Mesonia aestuariivivens]
MSEYSKNLSFDESLLESDFHKKNLEIGSLNLTEINYRTNLKTELEYKEVEGEYKFLSVVRENPHLNVQDDINFYLYWFLNSEDNTFQETFSDNIENEVSVISSEIERVLSSLPKKSNLVQPLINKSQRYINRYSDFAPKGVYKNLASSSESSLQSSVNSKIRPLEVLLKKLQNASK